MRVGIATTSLLFAALLGGCAAELTDAGSILGSWRVTEPDFALGVYEFAGDEDAGEVTFSNAPESPPAGCSRVWNAAGTFVRTETRLTIDWQSLTETVSGCPDPSMNGTGEASEAQLAERRIDSEYVLEEESLSFQLVNGTEASLRRE